MTLAQRPPAGSSPAPNTAFSQVRNLLSNFRQGIVDEQAEADARHKREEEWCRVEIAKAVALVEQRQHDVDSLKEHIAYLENELAEHEKDKKTREDRIVANDKLLEDFKKQRCDNNLLFVKQLREHMEAIDVLNLLRGDLAEYFKNKKSPKAASFLERFAEFSHLLNDEHKTIFVQLTDAVNNLPDVENLTNELNKVASHKQRTEEQVGDEHVDNKRGALKKLDHVAHEDVATYTNKLEAKVMNMIDALIKHLGDSREELTKNEIKAAEDFAVFQSNTAQENEHLRKTIAELAAEIEDFKNQINVANEQLDKREQLLENAKQALANLRRTCQEKRDYYNRENTRRDNELAGVDSATETFNNIVENMSARVRARANNLAAGKQAGQHIIKEVKEDEDEISGNMSNRQEKRNEVVF